MYLADTLNDAVIDALCSRTIGSFRIGVFRDSFPWLGEPEGDEGIKAHGRAERIHLEAERGRTPCGEDLPQGGNRPGDVFQLEEKVRWATAGEIRRLKQLEDEKGKLKKLVAYLSLDKATPQDALRPRLWFRMIQRLGCCKSQKTLFDGDPKNGSNE